MKTFKYIFVAAALGLVATSCAEMDLEPKGLLYDNVLMGSITVSRSTWHWPIRICLWKTSIMVRMETRRDMPR